MKTNDLIDAIGAVDDKEIAAARTGGVRRRFAPARIALVAAVIAALLLGCLPAMSAADLGPAYDLMYRMNPALAQQLRPVRRSCESAGIRMEVVAADVRGETAEVLISVKDLAGDRIDETADLFDSWSVRSAHDLSGGCVLTSFDKETRTAIFTLEMKTTDGAPIAKDKLTFSLGKLLVNRRKSDRTAIALEPSSLPENVPLTGNVDFRGGSVKDDPHAPERATAEDLRQMGLVMTPAADAERQILEGVSLTAAGYTDGYLRVRLLYRDILRTDNHGFLWLENENGERLEPLFSEVFWADGHRGDGTGCNDSYEEYVFRADASELRNCRLYGDFVTCEELIEGNWRVTFPLTAEK